MFRQIVVVALIALLIVNSEALCPSVFRVVNAVVPNTAPVDLLVDANAVTTNVAFRGVSQYFSVAPGAVTVSVRVTGTGTVLGTRTFRAFPGGAYTIIATGSITGPVGQLLFNSNLFVIQEDLFVPNPSNFRGVVHRASETSQLINFYALNLGNNNQTTIYNIAAKTAVAYPEQPTGSYSFTFTNTTGFILVNSQGNNEQLNTTVGSGVLFDLFNIGDNANNIPNQFATKTSSPSFDSTSGCVLVDGSTVLPDNTPFNPVSFTPIFCSASSLATGIAFLLALVALFF
jgi:hypothetical protein